MVNFGTQPSDCASTTTVLTAFLTSGRNYRKGWYRSMQKCLALAALSLSGTKGKVNGFGRMILVRPPFTTSRTPASYPTHLISFSHPITESKSGPLVTNMTQPTASPICTRSTLCGIMGSTLTLLLWILIQTSRSCLPHLRSLLMLCQTSSLTTSLTLAILPTAIQWEKSPSPNP